MKLRSSREINKVLKRGRRKGQAALQKTIQATVDGGPNELLDALNLVGPSFKSINSSRATSIRTPKASLQICWNEVARVYMDPRCRSRETGAASSGEPIKRK